VHEKLKNFTNQRKKGYYEGHVICTQYHINKVPEVFGKKGEEAVATELRQLHVRDVLDTRTPSELSTHERASALAYLMFLKEKRTGEVKGRGCAGGRPLRDYMTKEENSAPTVSIEALMLSCVIDAMERRDVAIVDIPGAFMQANMDDFVQLKMEGRLAELLVKVDPKLYRKFLSVENGRSTMYVKLKKALYGTLQAAMLFWKTLTAKLVSLGFKANPYDECVVNKIVHGQQFTILWHVDDIKISHADEQMYLM